VAVDGHRRHLEGSGQPPQADRLDATRIRRAQRGIDHTLRGQPAMGLDVIGHAG